jgi:hypothetical protein
VRWKLAANILAGEASCFRPARWRTDRENRWPQGAPGSRLLHGTLLIVSPDLIACEATGTKSGDGVNHLR